MLEHLRYHCKHNEAKLNDFGAITIAAFETVSDAIWFAKNNPQDGVDELWLMEYQDGTWVPIKLEWIKEDCENCGYRDNRRNTFKCNAIGNCVDHEQWIPKPSNSTIGK